MLSLYLTVTMSLSVRSSVYLMTSFNVQPRRCGLSTGLSAWIVYRNLRHQGPPYWKWHSGVPRTGECRPPPRRKSSPRLYLTRVRCPCCWRWRHTGRWRHIAHCRHTERGRQWRGRKAWSWRLGTLVGIQHPKEETYRASESEPWQKDVRQRCLIFILWRVCWWMVHVSSTVGYDRTVSIRTLFLSLLTWPSGLSRQLSGAVLTPLSSTPFLYCSFICRSCRLMACSLLLALYIVRLSLQQVRS